MTAARVKVVGFTHAPSHYPWNVLWLAERVFADDVDPVHAMSLWDAPVLTEPRRVPVDLIREPLNPADSKAVRVEVPEMVEGQFHPHVGYLQREKAAVYAPRMDAGIAPTAWVAAIPVGHRDDLSHPGLTLYVDWPD